jgi:hypothetical protein
MTSVANPLCRLALRTRLQSCVHLLQQRFEATPTGSPKRPNETSSCNCSTVPNTRGDDDGLKDYLLNQETAFNIHNPSLDHRVR